MADTERNKQTVARLFDSFRAGDIGAFDGLIVEDHIQHNPGRATGCRR
jgi:ketosteroid isomerase-like protein